MKRLATQAAERVKRAGHVDVFSHIDPDGITSGTIASQALERLGIDHEMHFLKKLDSRAVEEIKDRNPEAVWFTDLGSGLFHRLADLSGVITDHHLPSEVVVPGGDRDDLRDYMIPDMVHVNPHLVGIDGTSELSSSGTAYLVARALSRENQDLAALGAVGAVGDLQDRAQGRLVGANREVVGDGERSGVLQVIRDLRLFGRETRPVFRLLQYAHDPPLPHLTEDAEACIVFFLELGIDLKGEGGWRRWIDLEAEEKRTVVSELVMSLLQKGYGHAQARRLTGEVYLLPREEEGTPLHDAKEFATLLNACGRYEAGEVGYLVCRGDRGEAYKQALGLLKGHRRHIVTSLDVVDDVGVESLDHIQWFHGGDRIKDTVVGIAAGMVLGSGSVKQDMPLFAFAQAEDGVKVSARASQRLLQRGLNLAVVVREAAAKVGGEGGGHAVAAGATIPPGTEDEFLRIADGMVGVQLQA
ncbi:MAG: DHH family phosphoesterase [Candidatus Thermoplasmatota archaeon]|nr:DHH family phosphoesterase [Candidatus Thermoplasmatota archaeon]